MVTIVQPPKNAALRIIGNNLEEILKVSMQRVTREKIFYERNIMESLKVYNCTMISRFSCSERNGISIIYDPENIISESDLKNLSTKELRRKYRNLFKK